MVDTGAAITLLIKKWADAHGLTIKVAEYILGTNDMAVKIVGMTSMTLFVGAHFGVGKYCHLLGQLLQGLLGCNLLCGHNEALGATTITFPGPDQPCAISWL